MDRNNNNRRPFNNNNNNGGYRKPPQFFLSVMPDTTKVSVDLMFDTSFLYGVMEELNVSDRTAANMIRSAWRSRVFQDIPEGGGWCVLRPMEDGRKVAVWIMDKSEEREGDIYLGGLEDEEGEDGE